jgi:LydA holin phage, holin superfamily III
MTDLMGSGEWATWAYTGGAGVLGRLMFHAKQVQAGRRKPLSWALFWDIPIALGTGWIALGVASQLGLAWEPTMSAALIMAYLGPYGIDTLFVRWLESKLPSGETGNEKDAGNDNAA